MADRRKDMWKLLYNLVNRNETELNDVFVFVDDILCKEPSLIRYSVKDNINRFQDTFILWLVNKLVKSLKVENDLDHGNFENNLRIQRKLLNSCLINRGVLFETLVTAYITALDELCEGYAKVDLACQDEMEDQLLKISAFTSTASCLKEIDEDFHFPDIEVDIDYVDDYMQALLQVLHHGLFVGYTNYSTLFGNSLHTVLKVLKECDFSTKLYCLQYLGRFFEKISSLNTNLQDLFEISLRALTMMWNYMPIWLNNNCFAFSVFEDFVGESCSFLQILKGLLQQIERKDILVSHCFLLIEYIYEIHQWLRMRADQNTKILTEVFKSVTEFMFQLFNSLTVVIDHQDKYYDLVWRVVDDFPFILHLLPVYLQNDKDKSKEEKYFKVIKQKVIEFLNLNSWRNSHFEIAKECLNSLRLWGHLRYHKRQLLEFSNLHNMNLLRTTTQSNISINAEFNNWIEPLTLWTKKVVHANHTSVCEVGEITIAALLLQLDDMMLQLPEQIQSDLLGIILKPTKILDAAKIIKNDTTTLELSLEMLNLIDNIKMEVAVNIIKRSLTAVAKQVFKSNKEHDSLMFKFSRSLPSFVAKQWLTVDFIIKELLDGNIKNNEVYISLLKTVCCFSVGTNEVVAIKKFPFSANVCGINCSELFQTEVMCRKCFNYCLKPYKSLEEFLQENLSILCTRTNASAMGSHDEKLPASLKPLLMEHLFLNQELHLISNHLNYCDITPEDCLKAIFNNSDVTKIFLPTVSSILDKLMASDKDFVSHLSAAVLQKVIESLKPAHTPQHQKNVLQIISCCTQSALLTEHWLFHFFKMTFFYLVHPESKVVHEAILTACEMCSVYNIQPIQLWNWYKRDALNLIVKLMIYVYLTKGVRMTRSLKAPPLEKRSNIQLYISKVFKSTDDWVSRHEMPNRHIDMLENKKNRGY